MLKITHLSVAVEQKLILQEFNLSVAPGTVHALMGQNGSGKSTLAYALMGHPRYQIQAGSMTFHEQSLADLGPDKRAKLGIFLAFQHPYEIPGVTVATFLKEAHQAVSGSSLSVTQFNELLNTALHELGMDRSFMQRSLNEGFSGGEKKRLELLQMLILKPSLIILDEIDSGLDIDALACLERLLAHVRRTNPTVSIIMITHYQRMLNYVRPDYVHIMHAGSITRSGGSELAQELEHKGYHGLIAHN